MTTEGIFKMYVTGGGTRPSLGAIAKSIVDVGNLSTGDTTTIIPYDNSDPSVFTFDDFGLTNTGPLTVLDGTLPTGAGILIDADHEGRWKVWGMCGWSADGTGTTAMSFAIRAGSAYVDDYDHNTTFSFDSSDTLVYEDMSATISPFWVNVVDGDVIYGVFYSTISPGTGTLFDATLNAEYYGPES